MAEGKKKGSGAKSGQKNEKKAEADAKPSTEKAEKEAYAAEAHGHDDHAHAAHAPHKVDLREVFTIFVVLAVLTVIEVAVAKVPGISSMLKGFVLVSLAVTKAACVGLYYMHLKGETKVLKLTVAIPMATPAVYALVLISEAAWRLTR